MNPLGALYSPEFVLLVAFAWFYYKAAEIENSDQPLFWAGLSIAGFFLTWRILHWGVMGDILGQVMLVVIITGARALMDKKPK